ncbi:protein bem46 [Panicum miliaceum]|uniref:Protein bem46 n=1 Tax=Panicum miliaceum TaxID=4540 RepID=A0A3L6SST3_PANMI|nr:protein bem46 [Panicum miliaceum]
MFLAHRPAPYRQPPYRQTRKREAHCSSARWLTALAYGAGGVAVAGLAALVALQERLVYVPVLPGLARVPHHARAPPPLLRGRLALRAADGVRLHSWFIRHSPFCRGL